MRNTAPYITAFTLTRSIGNSKPKSSASAKASWSNRPHCLMIPSTLQGSSLVSTSELVSIPQPQSPAKPFYSKDSSAIHIQHGEFMKTGSGRQICSTWPLTQEEPVLPSPGGHRDSSCSHSRAGRWGGAAPGHQGLLGRQEAASGHHSTLRRPPQQLLSLAT